MENHTDPTGWSENLEHSMLNMIPLSHSAPQGPGIYVGEEAERVEESEVVYDARENNISLMHIQTQRDDMSHRSQSLPKYKPEKF